MRAIKTENENCIPGPAKKVRCTYEISTFLRDSEKPKPILVTWQNSFMGWVGPSFLGNLRGSSDFPFNGSNGPNGRIYGFGDGQATPRT